MTVQVKIVACDLEAVGVLAQDFQRAAKLAGGNLRAPADTLLNTWYGLGSFTRTYSFFAGGTDFTTQIANAQEKSFVDRMVALQAEYAANKRNKPETNSKGKIAIKEKAPGLTVVSYKNYERPSEIITRDKALAFKIA